MGKDEAMATKRRAWWMQHKYIFIYIKDVPFQSRLPSIIVIFSSSSNISLVNVQCRTHCSTAVSANISSMIWVRHVQFQYPLCCSLSSVCFYCFYQFVLRILWLVGMSNVLSLRLFELSQSYKLNICYKTHLLLPHYLSLLCDKHPDTDTELLQHNPGLLSALGTQHAALQQLLRSVEQIPSSKCFNQNRVRGHIWFCVVVVLCMVCLCVLICLLFTVFQLSRTDVTGTQQHRRRTTVTRTCAVWIM